MATLQCRKLTYAVWVSDEQKNVSCKSINWQHFPRFIEAWDVLWGDIVSVDDISHGEYVMSFWQLFLIAHWPHTAALVALGYILGGGCMTKLHSIRSVTWREQYLCTQGSTQAASYPVVGGPTLVIKHRGLKEFIPLFPETLYPLSSSICQDRRLVSVGWWVTNRMGDPSLCFWHGECRPSTCWLLSPKRLPIPGTMLTNKK